MAGIRDTVLTITERAVYLEIETTRTHFAGAGFRRKLAGIHDGN